MLVPVVLIERTPTEPDDWSVAVESVDVAVQGPGSDVPSFHTLALIDVGLIPWTSTFRRKTSPTEYTNPVSTADSTVTAELFCPRSHTWDLASRYTPIR